MTKELNHSKREPRLLERAAWNGSKNSRFKIILNFPYEEELTVSFKSFQEPEVSDFTRLSIEEYARLQNTIFGMITVSLDVRM